MIVSLIILFIVGIIVSLFIFYGGLLFLKDILDFFLSGGVKRLRTFSLTKQETRDILFVVIMIILLFIVALQKLIS